MSAFGKIVGEAQYVHKSALGHLEQDALIRVRKAIEVVPDGFNWNVVKIDLKNEARLSFLEYTDFELHAFPILLSSCNVNAENKDVKYRNYSKSNPPILHRKELLISNDFPEYSKFFSLTKELEELGAFENIVELGTKQRWEKALQDLGIRIDIKNDFHAVKLRAQQDFLVGLFYAITHLGSHTTLIHLHDNLHLIQVL